MNNPDSSKAIDLSVAVPVYNEERVIEAFCATLIPILDSLCLSYEVILVDDGSRDDTWGIIGSLCATNRVIRAVRLSRNFGQQVALSAGIEHARGRAVITMDADLQHPPREIPRMVSEWKKGAAIVAMSRNETRGISFLKRAGTGLFFRIVNSWSEVPLGYNMPDFRLLDRRVVDRFVALPERSRFVRGLVNWLGFEPVILHFTADAAAHQTTHYSFRKMAHLAMDALTSFTAFPLRLALYSGIVISLVSATYLLYAVYAAFFVSSAVRGWASLISVVLFLGGCQMIFLGIIGEYLARVYTEVKQRPLFVARERLNFPEDG